MKWLEHLYSELEAGPGSRGLGQGWYSGVAGLILAVASLVAVLILRYPLLLSTPEIRSFVDAGLFRLIVQGVLISAFVFAVVSLILREKRLLGILSVVLIFISIILGGSHAVRAAELTGEVYFALDWFILNLVFTGILFLPLERLFYRKPQDVFRTEWREDLFYFFISSVMVQVLTYLSMAPSLILLQYAKDIPFRVWVDSQSLWLQVLAIMFLTDFVQYWVHRAFHRIPALWRFHAVHHSARTMDWLAGSRMHFIEIVALRSITIIPMYVLGFSPTAIYIYLLIVYTYATYIHANVKWNIEALKPFVVTPRYHHWHHGIEKEAVDINFSIHFPIFDRLFGTYYMPKDKWPSGYGVANHPVPAGYIKQFLYPFIRESK